MEGRVYVWNCKQVDEFVVRQLEAGFFFLFSQWIIKCKFISKDFVNITIVEKSGNLSIIQIRLGENI